MVYRKFKKNYKNEMNENNVSKKNSSQNLQSSKEWQTLKTMNSQPSNKMKDFIRNKLEDDKILKDRRGIKIDRIIKSNRYT